MARSSDGGASWKVSEVPDLDSRYGAFPSDKVWYVSNGMWGDDPAAVDERSLSLNTFDTRLRSHHSYPLSARARIESLQKGSVHFTKRGSHVDNLFATGWWGTISKTEDGGETFSTVFSSDPNEYWYFNSIACSSETHCVAVAEGDDAGDSGYTILAFVTFDGGKTWTNALDKENVPSDVVSIMGAAWIDDKEGWLGATAKDRSQLNGVFFHTMDGGKTWSLDATLDNCFLMDLTFANGVGYASCSTSSGSNGYVTMYI